MSMTPFSVVPYNLQRRMRIFDPNAQYRKDYLYNARRGMCSWQLLPSIQRAQDPRLISASASRKCPGWVFSPSFSHRDGFEDTVVVVLRLYRHECYQ